MKHMVFFLLVLSFSSALSMQVPVITRRSNEVLLWQRPVPRGMSTIGTHISQGKFAQAGMLAIMGIDLNTLDGTGKNPLHHLADRYYQASYEEQAIELLKVLLSNGADPKVNDRTGLSAYDLLEDRQKRAGSKAQVYYRKFFALMNK